jgi:hypothetical protein
MDELNARFLPQFIALARARVARALAAVTERAPGAGAAVAHELHALVGEAGLLGQRDVIPLARDGEIKAKALGSGASDAAPLIETLRQLETVIESIGATHTSK